MNKRLIYVLLISIAIIAITGCTNSTGEIATLQKQVSELQTQIEELTQEKNKAVSERDSIKLQLEEIQKETVIEPGDVTIVVVDKVNTYKDPDNWIFSDYSTLHISITNNLEKDIKGIQGILDIQDMFGVSIFKSQCDLTGYTIKPNETIVNKDLSLEINQFMNDHVKVFNTDYDDLKFEYTVQQLMFTDGTSKVN